MADSTIFDLTAETAMTAAHEFVVQDTSAATPSQAATFALMGGLEVTTGSDADTTMAVGTLYRVDMSAWATAVRTYRLPSTAAVGERIGIYITAGNATHELAIRTVAASNDTINGTDYDSADWSKLFITGELVIFRCVVADTDWIVEHDGRIPCKVFAQDTGGGNITTTATSWDLGTSNVPIDNGSLVSTANDVITARRAADLWSVTTSLIGPSSMDVRVDLRRDVGGTPAAFFTVYADSSSGFGRATPAAATRLTSVADGEQIDMQLRSASGTGAKLTAVSNAPTITVVEVL